jgi:HK97 family phage prohead protease
MSKIYAKGFVSEVKQGGGITGAVASTGSLDRDGEILSPLGWELDNFKKAPRLLWSHKALDLPIGRVESIYIDPKDGSLRFDAIFAEKENDFAKKVADLMRGGFLNTFSVGFIPKERNGDMYTKQELLEISVVNIPANPEARTLSLYKSLEKELEEIEHKDADIHHKPEPDVTENYIRIRVEDPDKFVDGSFRTIDISKEKGIKSVIGKLKSDPSGPTHVQSYLFDKDKWNVAEAEAWVKDHKYFDEILEKFVSLEEKLLQVKEGRIISEKNRLSIRTAIDAMKQANSALEELLNSTEPPKKGDGDKKVGNRKAVKKDTKNDLLRALRIVDKAVEYSIQQVKKS